MQVFGVVSAAFLAAAMSGIPAVAQPLSQVGGPKELPPAAYRGNQYVDSAGCVFIRAGVGGQTTWVPRVSRDRKLVCGYEPTFPPGLVAGAEALKAPVPEVAAPAPATTAEPSVPEPETVAVPAPAAARPPLKAQPAPTPTRAADGSVRLVRVGPVGKGATYCLARIDQAQRYLLSDGRRVTQCGEVAANAPVAYLNSLGVPGLAVAEGSPSPAEARRALKADRGDYRVVWSNGQIATSVATPAKPRQAPAGAGRYVQVGVFADPANADRAIARLKALGLPVASAMSRKGGKPIKAVLAGPFTTSDDLQSALALARRNGYRDAFARS